MARLLAAEEAHLSGFFGKIVELYVRMMQALMKRPWALAGSSVVIVALSVVCYNFLGREFLPAMDEGGSSWTTLLRPAVLWPRLIAFCCISKKS